MARLRLIIAVLCLGFCVTAAPQGRATPITALNNPVTSPEETDPPTDEVRPLDLGAVGYFFHLGQPAASYALAGWLYSRPGAAAESRDTSAFAPGQDDPRASAVADALKAAGRFGAFGGSGGLSTPGAGSGGGRAGSPASLTTSPFGFGDLESVPPRTAALLSGQPPATNGGLLAGSLIPPTAVTSPRLDSAGADPGAGGPLADSSHPVAVMAPEPSGLVLALAGLSALALRVAYTRQGKPDPAAPPPI